jgi:acyl-lipid omega-6 desaturase (Delta-12 desaturase)
MQKTDYFDIKRQISFEKPLWITLAVMAADLVLAWFCFHLLSLNTLPAYLLSQVLLTIFYFHNFAILHEAGHGNVHKSRPVNTIIGHYASIFCFMPYFPWKLIHQEHHVWAGNIDKDPTMANLRKMREKGDVSPLVRFAWKSWVPLAALLQHFVFWFYPLTMWKTRRMTRQSFLQCAFSVGFLAAMYTVLFQLLPEQVNIGNLWLSFILYLVMTELVNLPHHVMMPTFRTTSQRNKLRPWEQHVTTRTCYYPYGFALLTLNFNLHIEHHFFPNLPWYRLPRLRQMIKPLLGDNYGELVGINWNLQNRSRDAGEIVLPEIPHRLLQS